MKKKIGSIFVEVGVVLRGRSPDMDRYWSIQELISMLRRVQVKYGSKAKVRFEAGHNNVDLQVLPSKKFRRSEHA